LYLIRKIVSDKLQTRAAERSNAVRARSLSTGVSHEQEKARGYLAASPLPLNLNGGRAARRTRGKL
jgi:hypothetical protein